MARLGQAAAAGRSPGEATMRQFRELAAVAPLEAQPFLVQAAIAERNGDLGAAQRLLLEARRREPRSIAARYLLSDLWLRSDRVADALGEMAVLARLVPGTAIQLVPALAQYAHTPGAAAELRKILAASPQLKNPLLNALASDPDNIELMLKLEPSMSESADGKMSDWQRRIVGTLVQAGDYRRAYQLWHDFAGVPENEGSDALLFNPEFRKVEVPPPFNWSFISSGAGFAEPENGSMRILFYGRENAVLASQLLLLAPGTYRFEAPAAGTVAPGILEWTVTCLPKKQEVAKLDLGSASSSQAVTFTVPAGKCDAQLIALEGRVQEMPDEIDVRVKPARLKRVSG
jgi:hypothetical protein